MAESFIVFETRALEPELLAQADAQMDFLNDFFGRIYDRKLANPQDDLTSALVQAKDEDGSALTKAEVANVIVAMFGAGFETTAHLIGNGMLAMHRDPDQWQALVANPEEIAPRAVEEVLRFESSLQGTYRTALQPALFGGFERAAGRARAVPARRGQSRSVRVRAGGRAGRHAQGFTHAVVRWRYPPLHRRSNSRGSKAASRSRPSPGACRTSKSTSTAPCGGRASCFAA